MTWGEEFKAPFQQIKNKEWLDNSCDGGDFSHVYIIVHEYFILQT
jgi:hypothetical protein